MSSWCADGPHSIGRRLLFPVQPLQSVGYILWRGLAEDQAVAHIALFEDRVTWALSATGYCLLYLVPSRAEEVAVGKRQINWVLYENVADTALPGVLTDAHGVVHPTSLPPGVASAAWDEAPRDLSRDRDRVDGASFRQRVQPMGIVEVVIAPRSLWQNPDVEHLIGSIRRACLDHVIVLHERHRRQLLIEDVHDDHHWRTHRALDLDGPVPRPVQRPAVGAINEVPEVGGRHHHDEGRAV